MLTQIVNQMEEVLIVHEQRYSQSVVGELNRSQTEKWSFNNIQLLCVLMAESRKTETQYLPS